MLSLGGNHEIHNEQVSLVLGKDFVLTFQERPGDVFDPLRERITSSKGRIRTLGPDHLAYALVDIIIDSYFVILEHYGEDIETLEEAISAKPSPQDLENINSFKREMLFLRKSVWPLREMLSSLIREESPLISSSVLTYLRDVYDHCVQIIDTVEILREVLSGLHDFYLSSLSHKMNEVMKVLTIVGTIFIPLSFFAGVYGMNFAHMPELAWRWAYPVFWLFILTAAGAMLVYFRQRKWL
jgi:magnesium transporter